MVGGASDEKLSSLDVNVVCKYQKASKNISAECVSKKMKKISKLAKKTTKKSADSITTIYLHF